MFKTFRNQQKIKDKQINFLLSDLEKSLEQYKESLENKDKQLAEAKRILLSAKQSFDKVSQKNRELKAYIVQIDQQFQQQQSQNKTKKYKKVILEEESENENDTESEQEFNIEDETIKEKPQIKKPRKKKSTSNVFDYINQNAKRHKNTLESTLNPTNDIRRSTAIDRTTSNYNDAKEKIQKIRELVSMGKYDADLVKYIPGLADLAIQVMLDDIDTREKVANPSYKDKEELDFQILLTDNYYVNPSNIHICFPIKI